MRPVPKDIQPNSIKNKVYIKKLLLFEEPYAYCIVIDFFEAGEMYINFSNNYNTAKLEFGYFWHAGPDELQDKLETAKNDRKIKGAYPLRDRALEIMGYDHNKSNNK
jgi:hypothetical protein